MDVRPATDSEDVTRDSKPKGKTQHSHGPQAASPAVVAEQTGRVLTEREQDWLDRLAADPASFAAIEREVHEQTRRQADLYVAGLLAKASERPEMVHHVDRVVAAAEAPLRPVEKKQRTDSGLERRRFRTYPVAVPSPSTNITRTGRPVRCLTSGPRIRISLSGNSTFSTAPVRPAAA